ncbi:MAG: rhodanese-like domain-containing protein [candidate division NC10 bacterium]|nr:rhodanese-like domain-containing protein [candidate division NC10 bacterium]
MLRKASGLLGIIILALAALAAPVAAADLKENIHTFLSALPADFETVAGKTLAAKQQSGENLFVLDVREPDEFKAGHIEGAANIPIRTLGRSLDKLPTDKSMPIAVVCKSGIRAAYGTMTLKLLGYANVKDVVGGMLAWEKDGYPVVK